MESVQVQLILYWISVVFCFIGTFFFVASLTFKKDHWVKIGLISAYLALLPMSAAMTMRIIETGRFPYWGVYEVFGSYAWGALFFYVVIQALRPGLKIAGTVVLPAALLMTGVAAMHSTEIAEIPKTFFTYWLWVHIFFAKLSYGSILIMAALAVTYLLKSNQEEKGTVNALLTKLPSLKQIDQLVYQFAAFAFVMLAIMIASGAIWAYEAWGRYWGWDPIETWALISWLIYGLYLHLRRFMGWQGRKSAWFAVFAVIMVVFSFFGIPLIYESVHEHLEYFVDA